MLALCVEGEAGYRPCGERRPSAPNFRHNADVNLARSEALLDPLDGLPPALAPLSSYFATRYRFWIELMRRRLAYLDDREPAALLRPIEGIEIADACRSTTTHLPGPDAPVDEPLPALNPWHRCANHEMHASRGQAGGYPESIWRAFLASERIHERVEPLDGCL
jgi:hypothetical protein